jgi:hypothetical protein
MHQSNRGSWQAMNFMKGNHRRKGEAAVTSLVLWERLIILLRKKRRYLIVRAIR